MAKKMNKEMMAIFVSAPKMARDNPNGWRQELFEKIFQEVGARECEIIAFDLRRTYPDFATWVIQRNKQI